MRVAIPTSQYNRTGNEFMHNTRLSSCELCSARKCLEPLYCQSSMHSVFFLRFGDGSWRQAEVCIVFLAGAVEVNALAQRALQQFAQWLWIEHPTFQLRGRHSTNELLLPQV